MDKKLAQETIQTITLEESSVVWLEKNKEILVAGKPFDIKTITRSGNNITFSGLFDFRDKVLKNQLEAYQNSKDRSASESNSFLLLLFANYYQVAEPINLNAPVLVNKEKEWQKYQDKIHSLYLEILIPPPRNV